MESPLKMIGWNKTIFRPTIAVVSVCTGGGEKSLRET